MIILNFPSFCHHYNQYWSKCNRLLYCRIKRLCILDENIHWDCGKCGTVLVTENYFNLHQFCIKTFQTIPLLWQTATFWGENSIPIPVCVALRLWSASFSLLHMMTTNSQWVLYLQWKTKYLVLKLSRVEWSRVDLVPRGVTALTLFRTEPC